MAGGDQVGSTTNTTATEQLRGYRAALYASFTRWPDALFELCDAMLSTPGPVTSVPALSLEPVFSRSHGSLYKALERGRIDEEKMRDLLASSRDPNWPLTFAIDASTWDRCDAECSPERGFHYSASKHSAGKPIVAGWSYQWACQLCPTPDSWTAPLDVVRVKPTMDPSSETIAQIRRVVARMPTEREVPMAVLDAGYDPAAISHGLKDVRVEVVVRIRSDRVFHLDPDPRRLGERGRPARHGRRFALADPASWHSPDATLVTHDNRYGTVTVSAWHGLHPRLHGRGRWKSEPEPPIVICSVLRVEVEHLPKTAAGVKKTLWLWWSGPGLPDLERCLRAYLRRFDIEHTYRFFKSVLGWTTPSIRTPEQADRWSLLVAAAYTELRLARRLVEDLRLPWERRLEPHALTPRRVRRGFRVLRAVIGSPASPPKSTVAGPGRPKGTRRPPRTRYPAVKKAA
jgi:hypothetical protein